MGQELKIVLGIIIIGAVLVALTARPDPTGFVNDRSIDAYSDMFFNYNIIRYPAEAEISTSQEANPLIGINLDTNSINFGILLGRDSSVKRQINLTSKDDLASKILIRAYGNIKPMLSFSDNEFVFSGHRSVYITFNSGSQPAGKYSGEVDVIIQRSKFDVLRYIMGY